MFIRTEVDDQQNNIQIFDRETMWKHVWPAEVKEYATAVNLEWITH
jgi:hypothetical protein